MAITLHSNGKSSAHAPQLTYWNIGGDEIHFFTEQKYNFALRHYGNTECTHDSFM
jgi:hypothetical protein